MGRQASARIKIATGAVALCAIAGVAILGSVSAKRSGTTHVPRTHVPEDRQQPTSRHESSVPSVKTTNGGTSQVTSSSGAPSYFIPQVTGVGTGDPALPVGYYWEFLTPDSSYEEKLDSELYSKLPSKERSYYEENPLYMITITGGTAAGQVAGMIYDRYEDGKLDTVFPFSGFVPPGGTTGTLTVTSDPTVVISNNQVVYSQATVTKGQTLPVTVSKGTITLSGCTNYLHWLSLVQPGYTYPANICTFYPTGGNALPSESQYPVLGQG